MEREREREREKVLGAHVITLKTIMKQFVSMYMDLKRYFETQSTAFSVINFIKIL
jgi:hypothetical protein